MLSGKLAVGLVEEAAAARRMSSVVTSADFVTLDAMFVSWSFLPDPVYPDDLQEY